MADDLLIVYALQHVFFFAYAIYMLVKFTPDIARKNEHVFFRTLIVSYLFYLVISVLWSFVEYDVIRMPSSIFWFLCICDMGAIALCGYVLYIFVLIRIAPDIADNRYVQYGSPLLFLIQIGGLISSPWTHWMISVTPGEVMVYEPGFVVLVGCSVIYYIILFAVCVMKLRQAKTDVRRNSIRTVMVAMILIIVCAVIDVRFEKVSILPTAIFGALYFIFINMQESSINTDHLTGMNNRRKATEYLSDKLTGVSNEKPMALYLLDINSFKGINDTYGHTEGDQALILLASCIKRCSARYNAFAARLGGDEFVLAWLPQKKTDDYERPVREIADAVRHECEDAKKLYTVTLCHGLAVCKDAQRNLSSYLKEADDHLYKDKERYYSGQTKHE